MMIDDPVICAWLVGVAKLFDTPPAFALPVFAELGTEEPFLVQDVSAEGMIMAFVPADLSAIIINRVGNPITREIGQPALLAFEDFDQQLHIDERESLGTKARPLVRDRRLHSRPFMRAVVAEFCKDAHAAREAEAAAVRSLAVAPRTASYYRLNVLIRERIKRGFQSQGSKAPSFRLRETEAGLQVQLAASVTPEELGLMRSALNRSESDLASLSSTGKSTWDCQIAPEQSNATNTADLEDDAMY